MSVDVCPISPTVKYAVIWWIIVTVVAILVDLDAKNEHVLW